MVQGRAHSWRGLSVIFNFTCNLVHERSEDAKNQSACYIFPSSSPLPAWGQLWKSGIELAELRVGTLSFAAQKSINSIRLFM